eukprot:CAMPEP_0179138556 /NCGR_PEP_ID=MMETSP0796-20121207/66185_1 /TAXON_ID=73915 /ORGANISM="Pyrodinium bahamense, Strain pbaha01" /LENGTH=183 /DNA_ID=CAMNT_0020837859 /DNA_START=160 /DNA_END=708 /DNA_ORIENTATION=-
MDRTGLVPRSQSGKHSQTASRAQLSPSFPSCSTPACAKQFRRTDSAIGRLSTKSRGPNCAATAHSSCVAAERTRPCEHLAKYGGLRLPGISNNTGSVNASQPSVCTTRRNSSDERRGVVSRPSVTPSCPAGSSMQQTCESSDESRQLADGSPAKDAAATSSCTSSRSKSSAQTIPPHVHASPD